MFGLFGRKKVKIGEISFFSFSYSRGCECNSNADYSLKWKDGGYVASVKPVGVGEEGAKTASVPDTFARELESILTEHGVSKWNGFQKSDSRILDGDTFGLLVMFKDKTSLNAHGYMRWPKNYGTVKEAIQTHFSKVISCND